MLFFNLKQIEKERLFEGTKRTMSTRRTDSLLVSQIRLICQKMKFSDLMKYSIIEDVFHIQICELHCEMNRYCLSSKSSSQLSQFLAETIRSCTIDELRDKLNLLKTWDIALKSQTKTWKACTLLDPLDKEMGPVSNASALKKQLMRSFHIKSLNAVINVVDHENLLWCAITGKKLTRRNGVRMENTVFFCISPGNPYLFTTPMTFPTEKLERIIYALNYSRVRNCHLVGKHIASLLKMIKTRVDTNASIGDITLSPANIEIGHRHTDYTRGKKIKNYASKCFDNNVVLQTLKVEAVTEWRASDILPAMENEQFNASMEISSHNIADTLSYFTAIGVLQPPFPGYLKNLQCSGKNDIKLKIKNRNCENQ